jgi:hypothetical protein
MVKRVVEKRNLRAAVRASVCAAVVLFTLGAPQYARANLIDPMFDLSWTGAYGPGTATLAATSVSGNEYLVTALTGTQDGTSISLLGSGVYGDNDNAIFVPGTPGQLDFPGLAFTDGIFDYNLFLYTLPGNTNTYTECRSNVATTCVGSDVNNGIPVTTLTITPATSTVPEPATVLLLATAALGAFVLRRRSTTP